MAVPKLMMMAACYTTCYYTRQLLHIRRILLLLLPTNEGLFEQHVSAAKKMPGANPRGERDKRERGEIRRREEERRESKKVPLSPIQGYRTAAAL